jgi:tetraacyldisaccharide 4'-kinase
VSGWAIARRAALAVPAAAYGAAIRLRNSWYDRPGHVRKGPVPVISVGNLAVGGTGKTPLVAWLARRLAAQGAVAAVVSRGYGGTAGPGPVVVSTGGGPRVDARICGDEPHLLARALPGTIVIVGADRVEGVRAAAKAGAAVVVLDDGFQHRRLARDLDIVLLDGRAPFDGGRLLPAGRLREPASSLGRAGVVVLTRLGEHDEAAASHAAVRATGFAGPIVRAGHRVIAYFDLDGKPQPAPAGALAFCGIGDPALFRADLEATGVRLAGFRAFRDHHAYSVAAWQSLCDQAARARVPLVTTEKDLSRLESVGGLSLGRASLLVLRIEAAVWDESVLLDALQRALGAPSRGGSR